MSTKVFLKAILPVGLLLVVFLAAPIVSGKSALAPARGNAVTAMGQDASFKIDPRSARPELNNLAGSDYIERHPSNYFAGSDYIDRHPLVVSIENFTGSDWIERHPANLFSVVNKDILAGSDYIERHPSNYFTGSDYGERHPSRYYAGSDWIERQP